MAKQPINTKASGKAENLRVVANGRPAMPKVKQTVNSRPIHALFKFEMETAGTQRFKEVDENGDFLTQKEAIIGTLYVKKSVIGNKVPADKLLTVTVTWES